tara:strand:+ start:3834 stop:4718 length:885 start_codon:yes stop_codon:yes gene_type:complete
MNRFLLAALAVVSLVSFSFSMDDCDAEAIYHIPAVPFCAGTMNQQCLNIAQDAHYAAWLDGPGFLAERNCRDYKRYHNQLAWIERLQADCDADPGSLVCDTLAYAIAASRQLAGEIDSRDLQVQIQEGIIDGAFIAAAHACCENNFVMMVPPTAPVDCDATYPGSPPLRVLVSGECYDSACVAAAQAQHASDWNDNVKGYVDLDCELNAERDGYLAEADRLEGLIADDIPYCYGGDAEACERMRVNTIDRDVALDYADAVASEIALNKSNLDYYRGQADGAFSDATDDCIYLCN